MTPDQINALRGLAEGWHKSGNTWCDICAHDLDGLIAQFTAEQPGGVVVQCSYRNYETYSDVCLGIATKNKRGYALCSACYDMNNSAEIAGDKFLTEFYSYSSPTPDKKTGGSSGEGE